MVSGVQLSVFVAGGAVMYQMMRTLTVVVLGMASILFVTGCTDVSGQVLNTIGLAGDIVSVWLQ
jgi:hypothetical protein